MPETRIVPQTALKYDVQVMEEGRVELHVPYPPGVHLTVVVIREPDDLVNDLMTAAESSLDFWNNPFDDQDWSDA